MQTRSRSSRSTGVCPSMPPSAVQNPISPVCGLISLGARSRFGPPVRQRSPLGQACSGQASDHDKPASFRATTSDCATSGMCGRGSGSCRQGFFRRSARVRSESLSAVRDCSTCMCVPHLLPDRAPHGQGAAGQRRARDRARTWRQFEPKTSMRHFAAPLRSILASLVISVAVRTSARATYWAS